MKEREGFKYMTVTITRSDQMLGANQLRNLSQSELLSLVKKNHTLGLIFNNNWEATMVEQKYLEALNEQIQQMAELIDYYKELVEEKEIFEQIKDRMNTPKSEYLTKPEGMSSYEWFRSRHPQTEVKE